MKKNIKLGKTIIVVTAVVVIAIYYKSTLGDILSEIRNLPVSMTIISILFSVIYYIIEGKLIQFVASRHVKGFTWMQGTAIAYISSFYRLLTMGAAAGPAEVYYLHLEKIPISRATGMCLAKYIIHRITIALSGIVCYLALTYEMKNILWPYRPYIIIGSLITAVYTIILITVCTSVKFSQLIIKGLMKVPVKKAGIQRKTNHLIDSIRLLQEESTVLLQDKKNVLWIFTLNIGKQVCYYLIPAIFLYHRSNISVLNVIALMAICNMLAGVLPAPSGIGSLEYVFLQLFQVLTKAGIAASVILMYRFVTWMVPFGIGGLFILLFRFCMSPRRRHSQT
jgi:uncharacterized membrane protein YbhN (UPF0104 family)